MGNFYSCWAAERSPVRATSPACATEAASGAHELVVKNYALLQGMGADECVTSTPFSVGGYDWSIDFCPDGDRRAPGYVSAFLRLRGCPAPAAAAATGVDVWYRLSLREKGGKVHARRPFLEQKFESAGNAWGDILIAPRSKLRGDTFTVRCDLVVIKEPTVLML